MACIFFPMKLGTIFVYLSKNHFLVTEVGTTFFNLMRQTFMITKVGTMLGKLEREPFLVDRNEIPYFEFGSNMRLLRSDVRSCLLYVCVCQRNYMLKCILPHYYRVYLWFAHWWTSMWVLEQDLKSPYVSHTHTRVNTPKLFIRKHSNTWPRCDKLLFFTKKKKKSHRTIQD